MNEFISPKSLADNIFEYKAKLMGVATIMIMIFHSYPFPYFLSIQLMGEMGVDLFLLLGGFTCSYSYLKNGADRNLVGFYKKRVKRILPSYLLLYIFVYGYEYFLAVHPNWNSVYNFLVSITMWNNIVHNSLRIWYVPIVLLMYLGTPPYIYVCQKSRYFFLVPILVILVFLAFGIKDLSIPLFMFWNRFPIYLIGVNLCLLRGRCIGIRTSILLIIGLLGLSLVLYSILDGKIDISFRRFFYIPILLCFVAFYNCNSRFLSFLGKISLEVYLIHRLLLVSLISNISLDLGESVYSVLAAILSIAMAYAYSKIVNTLLNTGIFGKSTILTISNHK